MSIVHIAFYPSDWLAGTRGMSDAETGVYITLIARIYELAGPVERDDERLFRLCGCRSKAAFRKSLDYLISEGKIIEVDGGLFNEKAAKVIKETVEKSSKAKAAAESRWNRKPNKNKARNSADASETHMPEGCQPEPEPELEEEDTSVSLSVPASQPHPANEVSEAVALYNEAASKNGWPKVAKLTPARSKKLKARLKDCGGIEGWRYALERSEASNFIRNQWTGFGFDSLVSQEKFTRLMEGNYDNRTDNRRQVANPDTADRIRAVAARAGKSPRGDLF